MTLREFLYALLRRWYVVILGGLLTGGLFVVLADSEPVYYGQARLVMLGPESEPDTNALQQPSPVAIAAVAVMTVNGEPLSLSAADNDATLFGRGIESGASVRLEHSGNQWRPSAPRPYIRVEATAATPELVASRIAQGVKDVTAAVRDFESQYRVSRSQRVVITQTPPVAVTTSIPTSPSRMLAGCLSLGIGASLMSVVGLERRRGRREIGNSA